MKLTDKEIQALRDDAKSAGHCDWLSAPQFIAICDTALVRAGATSAWRADFEAGAQSRQSVLEVIQWLTARGTLELSQIRGGYTYTLTEVAKLLKEAIAKGAL